MSVRIAPYTFIDAERLRFGKYPLLDTVLYRWVRRIEETLFEQLRVEVYAGASVVEEMKFSAFFSMLRHPRPIYFFTLEPFRGSGLFIVDNRFTAFCLRQMGRNVPAGGVKLSPHNQVRMQRVVQRMMEDFDRCWADIHPVRTRLQKVTTYPFRARILNPYENCLVAQIHLSGRGISSRIIWCFPRSLFDPLLDRLRASKVIPPLGQAREPHQRISLAALLEHLRYGLQVRMGRVDLSGATEPLAVGQLIPLENEAGERAVIEVDGNPALVAEVGQVADHYAIKVSGAYDPPEKKVRPAPERFRPLQWPSTSPE